MAGEVCDHRASTAQQRLLLKSVVRARLKALGGGASVQHITRVSEAQLSRYASPDCLEHVPLDVLLDIELDGGQPVITAALANALGWRLAPAEGPSHAAFSPSAGFCPSVSAASLVADAASLFRQAHAAMADGRLCEAERRALAAIAGDVQQTLLQLQEQLLGGGS